MHSLKWDSRSRRTEPEPEPAPRNVRLHRHGPDYMSSGVCPGQLVNTTFFGPLGAASWHRVRGERTFSVGQGLLRFLERVLSQEDLGGLQHRVDERPARLHVLHERLQRQREQKETPFTPGFARQRPPPAFQICTFLNKGHRRGKTTPPRR